MATTSTERGRKYAENHPQAARDRQRAHRMANKETPYYVLLFHAKHNILDLSKMPPFPDAAEGERDRAIKEAKECFGLQYYKMK